MMHRFILSLALGIATIFMIGLIKELSYTERRYAITDTLSLPGAYLASLVYPEGVHTGHGAVYWAEVVVFSNVILYVVFWYACLEIIARIRGKSPP